MVLVGEWTASWPWVMWRQLWWSKPEETEGQSVSLVGGVFWVTTNFCWSVRSLSPSSSFLVFFFRFLGTMSSIMESKDSWNRSWNRSSVPFSVLTSNRTTLWTQRLGSLIYLIRYLPLAERRWAWWGTPHRKHRLSPSLVSGSSELLAHL